MCHRDRWGFRGEKRGIGGPAPRWVQGGGVRCVTGTPAYGVRGQALRLGSGQAGVGFEVEKGDLGYGA
jgi:hypothetical protein